MNFSKRELTASLCLHELMQKFSWTRITFVTSISNSAAKMNIYLYENVTDYYFKFSLTFHVAIGCATCLRNVQTKADWDVLTLLILVQSWHFRESVKRGNKFWSETYAAMATFNKKTFLKTSMSDLPCHSRGKQIDTTPETFLAAPPNVSPIPHTPHHIITWLRHFSWKNAFYPFYYFTFAVNIFQPGIMLEAFQPLSLDSKITAVSCACCWGKYSNQSQERECFSSCWSPMKVKNHFQIAQRAALARPASAHSREDLSPEISWRESPTGFLSVFPSPADPRAVTQHQEVWNGTISGRGCPC